eukprot:TRINITY_DN66336_c6_g5_i1.p1 TRINITY_DN66336_c6_g5~~TRINITY_DN66336_c6_g5_i1.p1  ORF type:complete len:1091 (-),score=171.65 TRINITY_DN66336_c6_g5_i1:1267-4485(-)
MSLNEIPDKVSFSDEEETTLKYWQEKDCFRESVKRSEGKPLYTFYDGPPFATGLPHYGHILAGTIKDVVTRWAHQTGHHVERRFGWDCHGLPIEFEIEKALGIKSKEQVMEMGIANYNAECRKIVMRYSKEWETVVNRFGRWIDFENDYKTMHLSYMESVWWVFNQLWQKKLVYRGVKVMPYSTGCTTPLSNFEANSNYQDATDPSVMVSFPLVTDPEVHLLAWTTTPWTLPSNLALCAHPEMDYVKIKDKKTHGGKTFILMEARLEQLYPNLAKQKGKEPPFETLQKMKGADLKGLEYVPLFEYFLFKKEDGAFKVVNDTYVTADAGTGIVHQAPGFGEDDYRVCLKNGIITKDTAPPCPIDEGGKFTEAVSDFAGQYIKEADPLICKKLKDNGRLVEKKSIVHSYPFCWRSNTPLIYRTVASWFVGVTDIKEDLIKCAHDSYWVPEFVQTKRFNNWLENAIDWCVSRSRYWGTPLPIWHSEDWEELVCVGSVKELEELSGQKITDLHREFVDEITIPSKQGKGVLRRVPEVFDCWFESGSMPYGQAHYPFENKDKFDKGFPADFIAEGLDQTRGWFYTLMVLSTALFKKPAFKNLVVNGLVLAENGKKMSKSARNYPDPMDVVKRHSADAIRLYLINSPVVRAEPLRFKEEGVKEVVNDVFRPLWNGAKFFVQNYNRFVAAGHKFDPTDFSSKNVMDHWMIANNAELIKYVRGEMQAYKLSTVVPGLLRFLESLTNWYVRMNRSRLKGAEGVDDWSKSLTTLFEVLSTATVLMAPFTPFLAENLYTRLKPLFPEDKREDSVHYLMLPEANEKLLDPVILRKVSRMQTVIELTRVMRERTKMAIKMPVAEVVVATSDAEYLQDVVELQNYILEEVHSLKMITTENQTDYVTLSLDADKASLGKRFKKEAKAVEQAIQKLTEEETATFLANGGMSLCGHELTMDDVKVKRTFKEGIQDFDTNTDGKVLVLMKTTINEEQTAIYIAREFVNRVQTLRKSSGLTPNDAICVWYNADGIVDKTLAAKMDYVKAKLAVTSVETMAKKAGDTFADVDTEIVVGEEKCKVRLEFTKPQ